MGRGGAASQTPCAPQGLHPHPACVARSSWGWKGPLGTSQSNTPPPAQGKLLNLRRSFPMLLPCRRAPTAKGGVLCEASP